MKYKVCSSREDRRLRVVLKSLEDIVQPYLDKGWKTTGGVQTFPGEFSGCTVAIQALTLEEEEYL